MWLYILLLLIVGGSLNRTIRFYLQLILAVIGSSIVSICSIPFLDYTNKTSKNGYVTSSAITFFLRYMAGLKYNISGMENVVKGGAVIVLNHQTFLDVGPLAEMVIRIENLTGVSKSKVFYVFPYGFVMWLMGTIFIDKKEDPKQKINIFANAIKDRKVKIFFFPEGTRNGTDQLLPFKKGAFHLAIAAQCPIIPIVIGKSRHCTEKSFKQKVVEFSVLPPISTEGLISDDVAKLAEDTRTIMQTKFDDLSKNYIN